VRSGLRAVVRASPLPAGAALLLSAACSSNSGALPTGHPSADAAATDGAGAITDAGAAPEASSSNADGSAAETGVSDAKANALTCIPGWAHCSGDAVDVCETDLGQPGNCGSCGNECAVTALCVGAPASRACARPVAIATAYQASFALFSNGTLEAWGGTPGSGSLLGYGNAAVTMFADPLVVDAPSATAIAAGYAHACAVLSNETVACWGDNSFGQLGVELAADGGTPFVPGLEIGDGQGTATPTVVAGLSNVTAIAAGVTHTCALLSGGTVECWGSNDYGELGTTLSTSCNGGVDTCSPTPTPVPGLSNVTAIAVGGDGIQDADHTCALLSGGTIECWGYNADGELGNGTETTSSGPGPVSNVTNAIAVTAWSAGGCALISGGEVQCWGLNDDGELGDGITTSSSTPVAVSGLSDAVALSTSSTSATICAARSDGSAVCWGAGSHGKLGTGSGDSGADSTSPVVVDGLTNVSALAAGLQQTCAIAWGGVYCWGYDGDGEVGNTSADPDYNGRPLAVQW